MNVSTTTYTLYWEDIKEIVVPTPLEWGLCVLYVMVFIFAIVGNVLVCYAVRSHPNMHTVTNYFILNLSIGDIMVTLFCLPPTFVVDTTQSWFLGDIACKLIPFLQQVSSSVSAFTLMVICLDRYYAICQPLKFKSSTTRAKRFIVTIWFSSILLCLPYIYVYRCQMHDLLKPFPELHVYLKFCAEDWFDIYIFKGKDIKIVYRMLLIVLTYIVPMFCIAIIYCIIANALWRNEISGFAGAQQSQSKSSKAAAAENLLKQRRNVAKMLILVAICFAVCFMPMYTLNVIRELDMMHLMDPQTYANLMTLSHWLSYVNSALNPIIYNFTSAKFRAQFKTALMCCGKETKSKVRRHYQTTIVTESVRYDVDKINSNGPKSTNIHFNKNLSKA